MFHLHKTSQLVTVTPNMTLADYEHHLNEEGHTGGYHPLSGFQTSLQECLNRRIPNMLFLKYGGIDDLCAGGEVMTRQGNHFLIKTAPRAATGPDLKKVLIGSNEIFGTFKEVTLRIFPLPELEIWGLALVHSRELAKRLFRKMLAVMIKPVFAKMLEDEETEGLIASLNLDRSEDTILAFKLSGQKAMVRAEKEALHHMNEGEKVFFYWPEKAFEMEILDKTLINAEAYGQLIKQCTPLVGAIPREGLTAAEEEFIKFFK